MGSKRDAAHQLKIRTVRWGLFLIIYMLFALPGSLFGEEMRGQVEHTLQLGAEYEAVTAEIGIREITSIDFSHDEFLDGLVLEITTPNTVLQFRESFLLRFLGRVSPSLPSDSTRFSGRKILSKAFPAQRRTFIDMKIRSSADWEQSSLDSIFIDDSLLSGAFPLLFSIDPVMKGIPSHVSSSRFSVTLTPVLAEKGALNLSIQPGDASPSIDVLIDGSSVAAEKGKIYLDPGVHKLDIRSEAYLPYSQSFGIEQAQTTDIDIQLEPALSMVSIDAPENAVVFFDGREVLAADLSRIETVPGDHVILMRIEDYSVSKKISLIGGKNYKVSLIFDILINDN